MVAQVAQLANNEESDCETCDQRVRRAGGRSGRRVDPVSNVGTTEDPVVSRVLEDVARRHGSTGEAVYEDSLELALSKVQCQHDAGQPLQV